MVSHTSPSANRSTEAYSVPRRKPWHTVKAVVSFALCLALFIGLIPAQAVWAASDMLSPAPVITATVGQESVYDNAVDIQNVSDDDIVSEIVEKRAADTKYFRLTDGTTLAALYDEPVHTKDASGTWQTIDYRLSDMGDGYENTQGTMRIKFSKNPKNGNLYTLKIDEGQIKWSLSGVKGNAKAATLSQQNKKAGKLDVSTVSGTVTYADILPGVTLEYAITEGKVKENIIFADSESAGPLQFELQTNQFELTLQDNVIHFLNRDGESVFTMSAPYMIDNNGLTSDKITLSLDGKKNHYTVTVTPDAEWLKKATYPVTVDPVIGHLLQSYNNVNTIYVYSNRPNESATLNHGGITVGREGSTYDNCRGAVKFNLPDNITSSDRVVAASLRLTPRYVRPQTATVTIKAHQITSNVGLSGLTWNKLNGRYSTTVSDSQVITPAIGAANNPVPFDITGMVRDWYTNGNNYGVALVSGNENGAYQYVSLHTSEYSNNVNRWPTLIIQFANTNGLDDNITYHSAGNAEMGTVHVNDFNGNLVYTFDDVSTSGALFPINVTHVFDNARRNTAQYYHGSYSVGNGFRLNVCERIVEGTLDGYPYQYLDADGTWHYFKAKDGATNIYEDEFYPTRTIERLVDGNGNTTGFYLNDGSDIRTRFTSNGFVTYKEDTTNGKQADVVFYQNTAWPDKLVDGGGKSIAFSYETINSVCHLSTITDPAGRVTTFDYTDGRLTTITRPGNRFVNFTYDSNGCLTRITSYDGSAIAIDYYTTAYKDNQSLRRVKTLTEYGTDGSAGQTLTFTYATGETTVTDRDGKSETLMFDDFGQTVCVRDNQGNASFLKYNAPDMTDQINTDTVGASYAKATQLKYSSKMQSTVTNYVLNSDFEDTTLSRWNFENSTGSGAGSATLSTEHAYTGNQSLKIQSTSLTGRYGYQQAVTLPSLQPGKTYTISAYVKVTDITVDPTDSVSGAIVYFGYQCADDGTWGIKTSSSVKTVGDWVRISRTYTIPETFTTMIAKVGLYKATGTAYFDNVQIEEHAVVNSYNLIDNGHFTDSEGTAVPYSFVGYQLNSANDKVVTEDGRKCFKITGSRQTNKNLEQVVTLSGKKGDKYSFSAWAKAQGALSMRGCVSGADRNFQVRITFVEANGTWHSKYYSFESKSKNWQFLAGEAIANVDYQSVRMAVIYNKQENAIFMDDFCLFKEGSNTYYTYDDWGRVTAIDHLGEDNTAKTTYTYVVPYTSEASVLPDDRVASIHYPDGTTESYTYDDHKRVATHTDANGIVTTYHYDTLGNLLSQTVENPQDTANGTLVGNTTAYTSNGDYVSSVTDPFGNTTHTQTDNATGLISSITDTNGTVTSYTYDPNTDALTSVTVGDSQVHYGYTDNRLTSITRTADAATQGGYRFVYDVFGNVDSIKVGNTRTLIDHDYASYNGRLLKSTYGNGFYTENVYDALERIVGIKHNGVVQYTWEYDNKGQLGYLKDNVNQYEQRYVYDSKGRVVTVIGAPTAAGLSATTFVNTYNAKDRLTNVKRTVAGITLNTAYTYTDSGRLSREQYTGGAAVAYSYDALGRITSTLLRNHADAPLISHTYTYSSGSQTGTTTARVQSESVGGDGWSDTHVYTYDAAGNVIAVVTNGVTAEQYTYDALQQLLTAQTGGNTYAYTYDSNGNILTKTQNGTVTHYAYTDAQWRDLLTSYNGQTLTYDTIGNPLSYRDGMQFTWQGRRLDTATVNGSNLSFRYDTDGVRAQKTVDGVATYYTLDGTQIIRQKTGNTVLYFEYDAAGNVATVTYGGNTYYYVRNTLSNITGLTDDEGHVVVTYTYDPFGKLLSVTDNSGTGIGTLNPFRYKGYYYDTETGLYYLNSRYYDPEIGRFVNADGGIDTRFILGSNLYVYCLNNPLKYVDYSGKSVLVVLGIGLLVGGIIFIPSSSEQSTAAPVPDNVLLSKKATNRRDTGLQNVPDEEVQRRARDNSLSGKERRKYQEEEKVRGLRNKQKRNSKFSYELNASALEGVSMITVSVVGIAFVLADDATGLGVVDEPFLAPLILLFEQGVSRVIA